MLLMLQHVVHIMLLHVMLHTLTMLRHVLHALTMLMLMLMQMMVMVHVLLVLPQRVSSGRGDVTHSVSHTSSRCRSSRTVCCSRVS